MASNYFSLEIGDYYIKAADLIKKESRYESLGLGLIELNKLIFNSETEKTLEDQGHQIADFLKNLKIFKKNTNIVIPDSMSFNQIVEMPKLNERELLSAIKYQADQFIPMPIDEVSLDVEILYQYELEKKILALISAAPKKYIEKVQKVVEYAGLIPSSIEAEISAVGRFLSEHYKSPNENSNQGALFINVGFNATSFYFFNNHLKLLTQSHSFNIGYELFIKELQLNLTIDERKAINLLTEFPAQQNLEGVLSVLIKTFIAEVQKFMNQLSGKNQLAIDSIHLFNEVLRFPKLKDIIEKYFRVRTLIYNPQTALKPAPTENIAKQLPYFLSVFGSNLR